MAEVVNEIPAECIELRGNFSVYMDGQLWKLSIGTDVPKDAQRARARLYAAAFRRGLKARIRTVGDCMYFQALTKD